MESRAEVGIERGGLFPNLDEDVLNHFLGVSRIPQDAEGDREERRGDLIVEFRECREITGGNTLEQLRLSSLDLASRIWFEHNLGILPALPGRKRIGTTQLDESAEASPAPNCMCKQCIYF